MFYSFILISPVLLKLLFPKLPETSQLPNLVTCFYFFISFDFSTAVRTVDLPPFFSPLLP